MTTVSLCRPGVYDALPDLLSVGAVCTALGVPRRDWALFARWAGVLTGSSPAVSARSIGRALDEVYAYVDVMVAARCAHPQPDLVSWLIGADVLGDGDGLTADELRMVVVAMLVAGRR